jgi:hypothetical protein
LPYESGDMTSPNQRLGNIVCSTINGMVYMLKYQDKSLAHRFNLSCT